VRVHRKLFRLRERFRMPSEAEKRLAAVERAGKRLTDAETRLERAREDFHDAVRAAMAAGVSISAMARARGVSRQAIQKLVDRIGRD
jgi:hypothetical protein